MNNLPTFADANPEDARIMRGITEGFFGAIRKTATQPGHRPDLVLTGVLNAFALAVVTTAKDVTPEQISEFTHNCLEDALTNAHFAIAPPEQPVVCALFCWCDACHYTARILPEDAGHWQKPGPKYCPDCQAKGKDALLTHGTIPAEDQRLASPLPTWAPEFEDERDAGEPPRIETPGS